MPFAYTKLPGLDEHRLTAVIEPVLAAHHVAGVELIWRPDRGGMVLEITVERPESRVPGEGITLDLCADISRDLSTALDVDDLIGGRYRLEVGSPGLERTLYSLADFERFRGQGVKVKLTAPFEGAGPLFGQRVVRGTIFGTGEESIELMVGSSTVQIPWENISLARLVFDWDEGRGQKVSRGKPQGKNQGGAGKTAAKKTGSK